MLRQPIITIMGHVDHGKTSILDAIRGTAIAAGEAGGITQAIGASIIPQETLKHTCGDLLNKLGIKLTIPGLLFIDTPGHAAFSHHRKRGGDLADIAILVININEGIMPQTVECLNILRTCKTPFIIIANKIDMIEGWQTKQQPLLKTIETQHPTVLSRFETKLYELVGALFEHKFTAERFDRVQDYTKQIAIVPASAKTKEGIAEALMVLCGLTQKYLEQTLNYNPNGPACGTILEVKEEKGIGTVLDTILYDGTLKVNDTIVFATPDGPQTTKIKALLTPKPLTEMREKKSDFTTVTHISAATGVRISAAGLNNALAGTPLYSTTPATLQETKQKLLAEITSVTTTHDKEGLTIKADNLGSLEALIQLLKEHKIPVRNASIGSITKKDITDAQSAHNPHHATILGFNIQPVQIPGLKIITHNVIYQIIEDYKQWVTEETKKTELSGLSALTKPSKILLLPGYVFRQSNPAVVGIEVQAGTLTTGTPLMNEQGEPLTTAKNIQKEQENVAELKTNDRGAVSLPNITIGRGIKAGDILYSIITEDEFRKYKEYRDHLKTDEKNLLKEIAEIMRKQNPVWGV